MSATFEHISVFEDAAPETQLRVMVEFILETHYFDESALHKLEWRISKFAEARKIPYHKAATIVREEARRVAELRFEQIV